MMKRAAALKPLTVLLLALAGCASTPHAPVASSPEPASVPEPGQPVYLPYLQTPETPSFRRTATTDLRQRRARPTEVRRARPFFHQAFWLDGVRGNGPRRVVISLHHQIAQVWEGETLIAQSPVSTGKEGHHTPPGHYTIVDKRRHHHSSLYGEFINQSGQHVAPAKAGQTPPPGTRYVPSPMPYFLRLTWSGIGLHQGHLPGWPASHGCIRLPADMAARFFNELPKGTPVEIIQ